MKNFPQKCSLIQEMIESDVPSSFEHVFVGQTAAGAKSNGKLRDWFEMVFEVNEGRQSDDLVFLRYLKKFKSF